MREIKFRVWDTENKEMLRVQELDFEDTFYGGRLSIRTEQYNDYFDIEDMILMQYTGLHDKNGKEIYEGDIVKRSLYDAKEHRIFFEDFYQIVFEKGAFQYKGIKEYYIDKTGKKYGEMDKIYWQYLGSNFGVDIENIEVIGNIYENKELLNETNR